MYLAELVRTSRIAADLSQREMADGLCSAGYVSRIEQGKRLPSPRLLLALAEKLDVPLADIVGAYIASDPGPPRLSELAVLIIMKDHEQVAKEVLKATEAQLQRGCTTYRRDFAAHLKASSLWHEVFGDLHKARKLAVRRLDLVRELRAKPFVQAEAYLQAGGLSFKQNDVKQAEQLVYEAWRTVQQAVAADNRAVGTDRVSRLLQRVMWWLGHILLSTRQMEEAWYVYQQGRYIAELWEMSLEMPPTLQANIAVAALGVGQYEEARKLLEQLVTDDALSAEDRSMVLVNLGVCYRVQGKYELALQRVREAWALHERHDTSSGYNASVELAHLALARGDLDEASKWLDAFSGPAPDPATRAHRVILEAQVAHLQGRSALAASLLEDLFADPSVPLPHRLRAELALVRNRLPEDAERNIGDVLSQLEKHCERQML